MDGQQNATVTGRGNTIVQIVGEGNDVRIQGAAALRVVSYGGKAFAAAPSDKARAGQPGYTATGRRETAILYPYNRDCLPLQGRADLLGPLRTWLDDPAPIAVHALTGGGGSGKTRLAVELASEARAEGWIAGFARRDDLDVFRGTGSRTVWDASTLVVIDYAAAKTAELASWLRALANEDEEPEHKLRLLLLERQGGESASWWRDLFMVAGPEGEAVAGLLAAGAPLAVGPLADPDERHAVFAAAYRAASDTAPPSRHPGLDSVLARESLGGAPLFLAMFGLVAARQGVEAAKALTADRIAIELARQELDRIGRVWTARGLPRGDRPLHAHLAAVAALCEGLDEEAAHAAISREGAALHNSLPGGTEPARAALHAAIPGDAGGIAAIQPDILAEAAMIETWRLLPDGGAAAVCRAAAVQRNTVIRSVVRACQDFLIRGRREPFAWVRALQAELTDPDALLALVAAMPAGTLELRELALELTETAVAIARTLPEHNGAPLLASLLNDLSNRLSDLGRREAALLAIEEAVSTYRRLAEARPDAFLPDLALSLNNLSIRLSDLGGREAALLAIEEAVSIRRSLAVARPDAFLPDLASSLNNLSNNLSDLGRREAALVAIKEAVSIRRSLAVARPDAFLPDLARSLNNLSNRLSDLGGREAALVAIEEAVSTYRSLAVARPDAFLPDLASSLNNFSRCLSDLGRREAALLAIEEAVSTYRRLAEARPDAFLPNLATSLGARGAALREGDPAGAAASFAAGIATLRAPFLALPTAFASLMGRLYRDYIEASEAAGVGFNAELLAPIAAAFDQLRKEHDDGAEAD